MDNNDMLMYIIKKVDAIENKLGELPCKEYFNKISNIEGTIKTTKKNMMGIVTALIIDVLKITGIVVITGYIYMKGGLF